VYHEKESAMATTLVQTADQTRGVRLGGLGVRFLAGGEQTGGRVALIEHPIDPRALAAPMHTHEREDEISYVIAGQVGVQIGDQIMTAGPGTVVFKPRGIPHAFWNAGYIEARVVELITPAGFERYFEEMAALFAEANGGLPDPERAQAVMARYALRLDFGSIPALIAAHGLRG
jgi:quercetin dioxygenase-like cupin family protein